MPSKLLAKVTCVVCLSIRKGERWRWGGTWKLRGSRWLTVNGCQFSSISFHRHRGTYSCFLEYLSLLLGLCVIAISFINMRWGFPCLSAFQSLESRDWLVAQERKAKPLTISVATILFRQCVLGKFQKNFKLVQLNLILYALGKSTKFRVAWNFEWSCQGNLPLSAVLDFLREINL